MKTHRILLTVAPFLLFSAQTASAQGGNEKCFADCNAEFQVLLSTCDQYDPRSVDYEYCVTNAQSQQSSCYEPCYYQRDAIAVSKPGVPVYRGTQLAISITSSERT